MALEVVVVDLDMSVPLLSEVIGESHILAFEGFCWVARLDHCKAFGIASDDIVVLVVLQERLPLLAAVEARQRRNMLMPYMFSVHDHLMDLATIIVDFSIGCGPHW
jgi:hypothetical protein